jgi:hypothetical protein
MFVPGLVALEFIEYKHLVPLTEPLVLLLISGIVGLLTRCWPTEWTRDGVAQLSATAEGS